MKNAKKIIMTLVATLLLSTSVGHAEGLNYTIKTRFSNANIVKCSNGSNNYLQNSFGNFIIRFKPIYNWDKEDVEDNTQNEDADKEEENNENEEPVTEEKPEEPTESEKPEEQEKPEPQEPSKPEESKAEEQEEPSTPNEDLSVEKEVARLVNVERQKAGLAPLTFSEEISKVAEAKSQDMADKNYFSHTSPTYGDPFQMMKTFGIKYGYAGENIAKGYGSASSVMNGWMNSSGHKANILNSNFNKIGVGYVEANGTTYWTQMFTD